ncbi:MAG: hypothetical protein AAFX90_03070 [Pseudomonadota bacterium]
MAQSDRDTQEVKTFEHNAKEGARAVIVYWLTRRFVLPFLLVALACVTAAFAKNGPVAGIISLVVFTGPVVLLALFWTGQLRRVWNYWAR